MFHLLRDIAVTGAEFDRSDSWLTLYQIWAFWGFRPFSLKADISYNKLSKYMRHWFEERDEWAGNSFIVRRQKMKDSPPEPKRAIRFKFSRRQAGNTGNGLT